VAGLNHVGVIFLFMYSMTGGGEGWEGFVYDLAFLSSVVEALTKNPHTQKKTKVKDLSIRHEESKKENTEV
jgi:hypothetical protein